MDNYISYSTQNNRQAKNETEDGSDAIYSSSTQPASKSSPLQLKIK